MKKYALYIIDTGYFNFRDGQIVSFIFNCECLVQRLLFAHSPIAERIKALSETDRKDFMEIFCYNLRYLNLPRAAVKNGIIDDKRLNLCRSKSNLRSFQLRSGICWVCRNTEMFYRYTLLFPVTYILHAGH